MNQLFLLGYAKSLKEKQPVVHQLQNLQQPQKLPMMIQVAMPNHLTCFNLTSGNYLYLFVSEPEAPVVPSKCTEARISLCQGHTFPFKGTLSRDFRPSVFFIKQSHLGP
jgi:hypothetical protein